jgi:hypothetical protein
MQLEDNPGLFLATGECRHMNLACIGPGLGVVAEVAGGWAGGGGGVGAGDWTGGEGRDDPGLFMTTGKC